MCPKQSLHVAFSTTYSVCIRMDDQLDDDDDSDDDGGDGYLRPDNVVRRIRQAIADYL